VTRITEGFSHFVTSMTAPVASGWSDCRVGLAPTGKRHLFTAHTLSGQSTFSRADVRCYRLVANLRLEIDIEFPSGFFAFAKLYP